MNSCSCTPKILIVDDNQFNNVALEYIIKESGFAVDQAFNGKEAVEKYQADLDKTCNCTHRYSLILMDLQMPVMDGFEATQEIMEVCMENREMI